jgi:hypothetical protein
MLPGFYWAHRAVVSLRYRKMSKRGTAGKRRHVTLMIPQKLEVIRRLESHESVSVVTASYIIGSSTVSDIKKRTAFDHVWHQV